MPSQNDYQGNREGWQLAGIRGGVGTWGHYHHDDSFTEIL